ncbi:MAG: hypothetical protein ACRELB_05965 [Polyangiaceae bacterium]
MSRSKLVFSALAFAGVCWPAAARAQTVAAASQVNPVRLVSNKSQTVCGTSVTDTSCIGTRPANLTPLGISHQDCLDDQVLRFSVLMSGFAGGNNVTVWSSLTDDCTAITSRGGAGAVAATCWQLNASLNDPVYNTPNTVTFDVRVQDIVGHQASIPYPATYHPVGAEGCSTQAGIAAVPIFVDFVVTDSSGNPAGTSYQFNLPTDMIGPPAPGGVGTTAGDTLLNVSWTANSDADSSGYMLFIDPVPGQEEAGLGSTSGPTLVCPDTGAPIPEAGDESGGEAAADEASLSEGSVEASSVDATSDATTSDATTSDGAIPDGAPSDAGVSEAAASTDAGCYYVNTGGSSRDAAGSGACYNAVLSQGTTLDSGVTTVVPEASTVVDEAGTTADEGGTTVVEGAGGISAVPLQYAINSSSGFTVPDKAVGSYVVKGLTNNVTYYLAVSAVDGYGNVGPPSTTTCNYPAPIQDFWQTYEKDGGAGGGFCALDTVGTGGSSLAGVGLVLAGAAIARRRRRRSGK